MVRELPIQIVDKRNRIIGSMDKNEAKGQGLYHQLARVIAEDADGRILLQKRAATENYYPNLWDTSCAGHVDQGESYEVAAKRELREEIGVADVQLALIEEYLYTKVDYKQRDIRQFVRLYRINLDYTPTKLAKEEVDAVNWFAPKELISYIKTKPQDFTPGAIVALKKYVAHSPSQRRV